MGLCRSEIKKNSQYEEMSFPPSIIVFSRLDKTYLLRITNKFKKIIGQSLSFIKKTFICSKKQLLFGFIKDFSRYPGIWLCINVNYSDWIN